MFISNNPLRKTSGITLTETLISAGIIGIVLVGVLTVFIQTVDISRRIDYEYIATNIAKSRIERARTLIGTNGFSALSDLAETDTVLDLFGNADIDGEIKRSTAVTTNLGGNTRLTSIEVSVVYRYKGAWKDSAVIEMSTIFANVE